MAFLRPPRRGLRAAAAVALLSAVAVVAVGVISYHAIVSDEPDRAPVGAEETNRNDRGLAQVAVFDAPVERLAAPGGAPIGVVEPTWHDVEIAFPVIGREGAAVQIRLPERPNGSTAWVPAADVEIRPVPFRVAIDLSERRLRLYRDGEQLIEAPVGIGTDTNPTPTGDYFAAFHQHSPSAGYGPFVLVTTAHSETITDWQESGDAIVAIHGPLDTADEIGDTGAAVSHGCIRMHNQQLRALRAVPPGTPITITA